MAYTKQVWNCGDTITADKMNHIEEGIENAQNGYECIEGWTTLTDESVTTTLGEGDTVASGGLAYSEPITADTIKVTFNGTEYTVPAVTETAPAPFGTIYRYGAQLSDELGDYDFSTYPFSIASSPVSNAFATETAGTYQVKIETFEETVETSECFRKAVEQSTQPLFVEALSTVGGGGLNAPFIDIYNAFKQGRRVIGYQPDRAFEITGVYRTSSGGGEVVGNGQTYTASTDDAYPSYGNGGGGDIS